MPEKAPTQPPPPAGNQHRPWLLAVTALLAVLLNCYPIIFCNRSFVSPNNGAPNNGGNSLLYDTVPTLPGNFGDRIADLHGADSGAIMWHDVPNAFVEARNLWSEHALPLWNRYKNAGDPLLTQGISMFGDPLHFIVLLGRGSAWAWDIKFLVAKVLFCFGCGWLVQTITQRQSLALLLTIAAAYCGLFNFVPNHPGFFVFCYSPWILLSVIKVLAERGRWQVAWGWLWLTANTGCFNAGHIEAAVVCIGGLNLTGLVHALTGTGRSRWHVAVTMTALTVLFAGLNAPVWLPFLSYLPNSFNLHTDVAIEQFPLGVLAGLADDCFYHAVQDGPLAMGPGGTMFGFFGTLFALASSRELSRERFFFVNLGALVACGGFIFGYIPPSVVAHLPFIRQIGHIRADFSYLAILQLFIGSAYGCLALIRLQERGAKAVFWRRWSAAAGSLVLVALLFFWTTRLTTKPADFYVYLSLITFAVLAAPPVYLFYRDTAGTARLAGGCVLGVLLFLPHARFGLYTFGPDRWLLNPGERARLDSPSAAVDYMKSHAEEPFRATGLAWDLYGGYSAVYGLEDIKGVSALMNRDYMELCSHYPGVERDAYLIELSDPAAAQNLLSMLNVRYLVQNPDDPPPDSLPYRLVGKYDLNVFENATVWPRAFFTNKVQTYQGIDDFISLLKQNGEHPFAAIAETDFIRHPELQPLTTSREPLLTHPASSYHLGANESTFEIDAPTSGLAILSETYLATGFISKVNGVPHEVLRLNHALKGVFLDKPGHYRVIFRYRPPYWASALRMCAVSLTLMIVWTIARLGNVSAKAFKNLANRR